MELLTDLKKRISEDKLSSCYVILPHYDLLRLKPIISNSDEYILIRKKEIELAMEYEACWVLFIASEHLDKGDYEILIPKL